jgi:hypothetical protein
MVPVLVIASGYAFETLGRFDALDDPAAWRMWVPTVALGTGLPAISMIVRLHRDRWNWRDRLMPAQPTDHAAPPVRVDIQQKVSRRRGSG